MTVTRADAWQLLNEYTKNESLLKHELAVEAAVGGYARRFGEDEEGWGIAALLHDFDYERWPNASDHLPVFDRKSQQRSPTRMTDLVFFYGTLMSGFHRTGPLASGPNAQAGRPRVGPGGSLRSRRLSRRDSRSGRPRVGGSSSDDRCLIGAERARRDRGAQRRRARHQSVYTPGNSGDLRTRTRRPRLGVLLQRPPWPSQRISSGDYLEHLKVK